MVIHPCLILQRKIVNKVFRSVLTGVISVGIFSSLSIAPASAVGITPHNNPATPISLSSDGTPAVGSVLTVTKQTYTTFTETRFGVSWLRCNSATTIKNTESEVYAALASCTQLGQADGVTSSDMTTYTVKAIDVGKHITAVVNATDGIGNAMPNNEGYSLANSLLITASTSTPTPSPSTTTTPAPKAKVTQKVPAIAKTVKVNKTISFKKTTNAKLLMVVKNSTPKICKVAVKGANFTVTGLKPGNCKITLSQKGSATANPLKATVKTIKVVK